jgi:hypothetical protein
MSGGRVSKVVFGVVVMTLLFVFSAASAGASTQPVTGTATTSNGDGFTTKDFTYSSPGLLGSGTIHFAFDLTLVRNTPPNPLFEFLINGTGVLTRSDGATLAGTETGTIAVTVSPFPVVIHLAVTSATGGLAGTTGELDLTGGIAVPDSIGDEFAMTGSLTTPAPTPSDKAQCKSDGWRTLVDQSGAPFPNQGQCVSTVEPSRAKHHNRVSLADLAGSFTGTTSYTFGTNGCAFVHQVFDASYPGSGTVGTVTLHIEGCVSSSITNYTGTFTISTSVGTLSGTATGAVNLGASGVTFDLTLTTTAGTDAFASATGTLHSLISWPGKPGTNISGAVTVP